MLFFDSSILLIDYIRFWFKSKTIHSIHSEYVFQFAHEVVDANFGHEIYEIETQRVQLKSSKGYFNKTDYGAGSRLQNANKQQIKISAIANAAVSPKFQCNWLRNIIKWHNPENVLELGTSLGIATAYMGINSPRVKITTVEGDPSIANIARNVFDKLALTNIDLVVGQFDDVIEKLEKEGKTFDLIYLDGNHTYESTIKYEKSLKQLLSKNGIIIFDDIYWSAGMKKAWKEIVNTNNHLLTIDLFFWGIVFYHSPQIIPNQFAISPKKWKPFSFGLFG